MRGYYRLTHIAFLLSHITLNECSTIEICLNGGPQMFKEIYLNELGLCPNGLLYAILRMAESHNEILNILPTLNLSNNNLKWTWPKGRQHISSNRESPFECAKREFLEEVEIILPRPLFISNTYISENIKTITGRNIESRYWIYVIPHEIPIDKPKSHPEVADRLWVDTQLCCAMIDQSPTYLTVFDQLVNID